jgi:hypothetical protein
MEGLGLAMALHPDPLTGMMLLNGIDGASNNLRALAIERVGEAGQIWHRKSLVLRLADCILPRTIRVVPSQEPKLHVGRRAR